MGASAAFERSTLPVEPGAQAEVQLRVRNTGGVVDSFTFEAVGLPGNWVQVQPAEVRLFPDTEEHVTVTVAPPRSSETPLGELIMALRVISAEDPGGSVAEELTLVIGEFGQRFAELHPRTSTGRTKGEHELAIDNFGNTEVTPTFEGLDPDGLLTFEIKPPTATIAPGAAHISTVVVRPRKRFWRGQPKSIPFQIAVHHGGAGESVTGDAGTGEGDEFDPANAEATAAGSDGDGPDLVDGTFLQQPMVPKWFWKLLLLLLALLILLWLLWQLLLKPTVESTARDSAEEVVAEEVDAINERLDAAGIPEAGGGGGGGGGETTTTTTTTTSSVPVVPVTTATTPPTTAPGTTIAGATTTTPASTTTTTTMAPISDTGPFDFRLEIFDDPADTNPSLVAQAVAAGTRMEVTDMILQNPTGATGEFRIRRSGEVLLSTNLANFRDLDLHFVAPYLFDEDESIEVVLLCTGQGTVAPLLDEGQPGACRAAVSFAGFVTTQSP
jgi:hypothetical protein